MFLEPEEAERDVWTLKCKEKTADGLKYCWLLPVMREGRSWNDYASLAKQGNATLQGTHPVNSLISFWGRVALWVMQDGSFGCWAMENIANRM